MKRPCIYKLTTFNFECIPGIGSEGNFDCGVCYCISFRKVLTKSLATGITLWSRIKLENHINHHSSVLKEHEQISCNNCCVMNHSSASPCLQIHKTDKTTSGMQAIWHQFFC